MAWTEAHGELLQKTNREMESYQAQMLNVPTLSRTNNTLRPTGSTMSATSPPVRVWTGLTLARPLCPLLGNSRRRPSSSSGTFLPPGKCLSTKTISTPLPVRMPRSSSHEPLRKARTPSLNGRTTWTTSPSVPGRSASAPTGRSPGRMVLSCSSRWQIQRPPIPSPSFLCAGRTPPVWVTTTPG